MFGCFTKASLAVDGDSHGGSLEEPELDLSYQQALIAAWGSGGSAARGRRLDNMLRGKLSPGTQLDGGRFEVTRAIKSGGMGAVYEVVDRRLGNKAFALKEMLVGSSSDPVERQAARERFIAEIQVMLSLRHPNIPRFTASFMQENSFYFVMEFVRGIDLSQVLKERGCPGLPVDEVVSYGVQMLEALKYLHSLHPPVVHRDIKPSNILRREEDGTAVLIDFGIARVSNPGEGLWIGTPGYAPVEQQFGRPEPRSDLYALGVTMHELITGVRPPEDDFEFPTFGSLGISVDPNLEGVLRQSLEKFPADRIASAEQMLQKLRELGHGGDLNMGDRGRDFEAGVSVYKESSLDPLLRDLMSRYGNECHTRYLPKNLDFLQFVLACPTEFELQVVKDEDCGKVRFLERQGLLDAKQFGEIDPLADDSSLRTRELIDLFVDRYESFKCSSWGFSG